MVPPRSPAAGKHSESPEALLDAPKVEGLFASEKVCFFQTPAPLRLWGPLALVYPQRVICAVWAKMFVVLPSRGCSCQPCPWTSPSSSKHQLCPERQKLPVIIRISDFFPKGTGNVVLTIIAEAPFMQLVDQCRALYSHCIWRVKVSAWPDSAHRGPWWYPGDRRLKLLDEKNLLVVVLLCSLQLWKSSEPTQDPSPSPAPSPTHAPGPPAVSPQAIKYFVSFPFLFPLFSPASLFFLLRQALSV